MSSFERHDSARDSADQPLPSLTDAMDAGIAETPIIRSNADRRTQLADPLFLMLMDRRGTTEVTEEQDIASPRPDGRRRKRTAESQLTLRRRDGLEFTRQGEVLVVIEDLEGNERVFEASITTEGIDDWDQSYNASLVANLEDWADKAGASEVLLHTDEPTLRLTLARLGYVPDDPNAFVRSWMERAGVVIRLVLDPDFADTHDADGAPDATFAEQVKRYGNGWAKILDRLIEPDDEVDEEFAEFFDDDSPRVSFNAEIERLEVTGDLGAKTVELLGRFTPRYLTDLTFGVGTDDPKMIGAVAVGVADWDAKKKLNTSVGGGDVSAAASQSAGEQDNQVFVPQNWN
jgi:hypothetical protein